MSSSRPEVDASGRLEVLVPEKPLHLSEAYRLRFKANDSKPLHLMIRQEAERAIGPGGSLVPDLVDGADQIDPLMQKGAGEEYVTVFPGRLGKLTFLVTAIYGDGGILTKEVPAYVEPSLKDHLALGFSSSILISIVFPTRGTLNPVADYGRERFRSGIPLDIHSMGINIKTAASLPIVRVDPTIGFVIPLRVGHALIETSYGGLTSRTCAVVLEKRQDMDRKHPDCSDLLGPGEKLGGAK